MVDLAWPHWSVGDAAKILCPRGKVGEYVEFEQKGTDCNIEGLLSVLIIYIKT